MTDFDGTLKSLILAYISDPDSNIRKIRKATRDNYVNLLRRLNRDHGAERIADIRSRTLLRWHEQWTGDGTKIATAHSLIGMIRTICTFGATILEDAESARVSSQLSKMRFKMPAARTERITAAQVNAIRAVAHQRSLPMIALAQAIQFDGMFRQKDVIGEREHGKWMRGLTWDEIDDDFILRHLTSKKQKPVTIDLKLAPMVMDELSLWADPIDDGGRVTDLSGIDPSMAQILARIREIIEEMPGRPPSANLPVPKAEPRPEGSPVLTRDMLPKAGPIIVDNHTGEPYQAQDFRRTWRKIAREAGVPDKVFNMDTRAGAITEAIDSGANIDLVRQAATHSNRSTTEKYIRNPEGARATVQKKRAEKRKKDDEAE